MISILITTTYLILIAYIFRTIKNVLHHLYLWQIKEYRVDRMLAYLKTSTGRIWIFGLFSSIKTIIFLVLLITYPHFLLNPIYNPSNIFHVIYGTSLILFWLIWVFEAFLNIKALIQRKWLIPKFTPKIILILIIVLWFQFLFFFLGKFINQLTWGILMDRLLWIIVSVPILIIAIPSLFIKRIIINKAKNKIAQLKNLTVIGITGSYGKTSTKEFLATILEEKFKVAKTPEFTNTDIGIANYILKELKPEHEVFVVEMGAYKKGEIKTICDMVKPQIGVITGINEQHLELFGTLQNTMKAKYELIESLPKEGIAIFNSNNGYCRKMAEWAKDLKLKVLGFDIAKDVKNIQIFPDHLEFPLADNHDLIKANLLGRQAVENILAAVYAAKSLGLTGKEIKAGVTRIVPAAKTMQLVGKLGGMLLVDDTFNANPDGVLAAIDYMKQYKGKKILVLTPLIELGREVDEIHTRIGEQASRICDLILLTNINYYKSFVEGAKRMKNEEKIQIVNTSVGTKLIRENSDKDGVVLFEGKEARKILNKLVKLD